MTDMTEKDKEYTAGVLERLVAEVGSLRIEADKAGQWVTPIPGDCLAFAVTEIAEAVDADLRQSPHYLRHKRKKVDMIGELADTAIMLVSYTIAQGFGVFEIKRKISIKHGNLLPDIAYFVANAWRLDVQCRAHESALEDVVQALSAIVSRIQAWGQDPDVVFGCRIERLRKRWVTPYQNRGAPLIKEGGGVRLLKCPTCTAHYLPKDIQQCPTCGEDLIGSDVYQLSLKEEAQCQCPE